MHTGCHPPTRLQGILFHPWKQTIYYVCSTIKMEFSGFTAQENFDVTIFINCST
jgi:hypothetical protein